jgi:hypothetical protein
VYGKGKERKKERGMARKIDESSERYMKCKEGCHIVER